jgi:hypothetical protein
MALGDHYSGLQGPKRFVHFVSENCGRWAPAINNENFRY